MLFTKWKFWAYVVVTSTVAAVFAALIHPGAVIGGLLGGIAACNEHWFD